MKNNENVYGLLDYENSYFFCLNCANLLHTFLNEKGEGKALCQKCGCTSQIKKYRRKLQVTIYQPKEDVYSLYTQYNDCV